jgi:hypothetical protein
VARASPQSRVGVGPSQRRRNNENRKHAFGCVLSGTFGRYVDITRLGAVPRVGGGRCTMSGSGRESISDRRRILGYEERSRTCVPGLPSRPWLSSLVPCRLRNARSGRQPRQHRTCRNQNRGACPSRRVRHTAFREFQPSLRHFDEGSANHDICRLSGYGQALGGQSPSFTRPIPRQC